MDIGHGHYRNEFSGLGCQLLLHECLLMTCLMVDRYNPWHQGLCRFQKGSSNQATEDKTLLANVCQNAKCFTAAGQGVHGSLEIAEWFDKQNQTGWQELLQQRQGCDVISLAHFLPHQVFSSCPFGLVFRINSSILISSLYVAWGSIMLHVHDIWTTVCVC